MGRSIKNTVSGFPILLLVAVVLFSCHEGGKVPSGHFSSPRTDFTELSVEFLQQIKAGKDTRLIQDRLANTSIVSLKNNLKTDAQRFAFWVNVYNAYILVILREHPQYYDDRSDFFSREQIPIAGEKVSFATIEHGILRRSQWDKGLGYVRKWFPSKFERNFRVEKKDYRIHFALNCGARDCPPVALYTPERIEGQFTKGTARYLERTTEYNASQNKVKVTALFSWFRGDFGGKSGVKKILESHNLVPSAKKVKLHHKNYDWTLDLDNFIEL